MKGFAQNTRARDQLRSFASDFLAPLPIVSMILFVAISTWNDSGWTASNQGTVENNLPSEVSSPVHLRTRLKCESVANRQYYFYISQDSLKTSLKNYILLSSLYSGLI